MVSVFQRGASLSALVERAAFCREAASNLGGRPSPTRHLEINYLQNLEALLDDARYASYVLRGRPADFPVAGYRGITSLAFSKLAAGEAALSPDVLDALAARSAPSDGYPELRLRLQLLRELGDHPRLSPGLRELASYIQPAQFTLARLELEARRRGESVEQSRVLTTQNYERVRPVNTQELPWHALSRHLDRRSAALLADTLVENSMKVTGAISYCYAAFKAGLEAVIPDIRSVAPLGGADNWWQYYNTRSEYLGHARMRRIEPDSVDWFSPLPPEKTGLLGLVLNYNPACPETWLSEQTPLSGHIDAIARDVEPLPFNAARQDFRVCAEKCRALTMVKLRRILAARSGSERCIAVFAFVSDNPLPMGDSQLNDVEQEPATEAERFSKERISRRRTRHAEMAERDRALEKVSPLQFFQGSQEP